MTFDPPYPRLPRKFVCCSARLRVRRTCNARVALYG
jgi:hypothetical protein